MKKILVPTDFSESASNALNYAIELAKRESSEIVLLHTYHVHYTSLYGANATDVVNSKEDADAKLHAQALKIEHAGSIPYEMISREDLAVDAILNVIEEKKIDLVVMGTKGASGLKEVFVGSNTARVIQRAPCPVIAIPEGVPVKDISRISYATDYRHADLFALPALLEIAVPFEAEIKFVHVASKENGHQGNVMNMFLSEVARRTDYKKISSDVIHGEDVVIALEEYLEAGKTDLLVLATHQRHLMDKLFERSITQKLAYHAHTPLLVLHYQKEEIYIT